MICATKTFVIGCHQDHIRDRRHRVGLNIRGVLTRQDLVSTKICDTSRLMQHPLVFVGRVARAEQCIAVLCQPPAILNQGGQVFGHKRFAQCLGEVLELVASILFLHAFVDRPGCILDHLIREVAFPSCRSGQSGRGLRDAFGTDRRSQREGRYRNAVLMHSYLRRSRLKTMHEVVAVVYFTGDRSLRCGCTSLGASRSWGHEGVSQGLQQWKLLDIQ
mmetsp:Transcript_12376/g.35295  ORF Transcript_12376/g.35295 Transcript_12376/m.35295 type:complete len:218 (-) Transcript_12376:2206-2859(-)